MTVDSPAHVDDGDGLLCPECGYDLRGTEGDRCSECGEAFDRAVLSVSGMPWVRRREMGRARAYIRTVWLMTFGRRRLRYEPSRPQDLRDARAFGRVTAGILMLASVGVFLGDIVGRQGLDTFKIDPGPFIGGTLLARLLDLLLPWSAGAMLPATGPVVTVLVAMYVAWAQGRVFRERGASKRRQEQLAALACYTLGPLAWLLPAAVCFEIAIYVGHQPYSLPAGTEPLGQAGWFVAVGVVAASLARLGWWLTDVGVRKSVKEVRTLGPLVWIAPLALAGWAVGMLGDFHLRGTPSRTAVLWGFLIGIFCCVMMSLMTFVRTAQWVMRARHGGWGTGLLAVVRMLGWWAVGAVVLPGLLVWCVGFLWLVVGTLW